jgi:hypothetical protein
MAHLIRLIDAVAANDGDGDGVKIQRIASRHLNSVLDPFLMLDEINTTTRNWVSFLKEPYPLCEYNLESRTQPSRFYTDQKIIFVLQH